MKFYTNLNKLHEFKFSTYYDIWHMWFYLCLLPKDEKHLFLDKFSARSKNIFKSILNVNDKFCLSIEECDYVLLPPTTIWENPVSKYNLEIKNAIKNNKKIIIFIGNDNDSSCNIPSEIGYVFRGSGFLKKTTDNIFGLPTVNIDVFAGNYARKKLSIAFCGFTMPPHRIGEKKLFWHDGIEIRTNIVEKFLKEIPEKCDFILNENWGPWQSGNDFSTKFYKNIKNNLYGLCVRGGGNFSFRLGEVLMMGRIPILIDTDCILPFPDLIPYDTNFIRIPIEKIDDMVNIIEKYHESHTEEELIQIQKENRLIWETYYVPCNAFTQVKSIINSHK
jgi:hypothetical protein